MSPALWADSLPAEPQGKPKNTGVGRLFLLQQIFLTQESNQDLMHCRRILYQGSYAMREAHPNQNLLILQGKLLTGMYLSGQCHLAGSAAAVSC